MGILNVTPDSFSDGGRYLEPDAALDHALEMQGEGAAIIDVGGESTRPSGARAVSAEVEVNRVLPVIRKLAHKLDVPISVDTRKASVAEAALAEGAAIVNDVSGMGDSDMAPVVARAGCALVLMHMRGGPEDHSRYAEYGDVVEEVARYLEERVRLALEAGIAPQNLILDPV
jgi:dihydropteroate synthase